MQNGHGLPSRSRHPPIDTTPLSCQIKRDVMDRSWRSYLGIVIVAGLVCLVSLPRAAQSQADVFVEPFATVTRLFGDATGFVGVRAGVISRSGFSADIGLDVLTHSVYRNPGPYVGDQITAMTRLSLGLHYSLRVVQDLRVSVGGASSVGFAQGQFCGGTDVCTSPELYSSIGPELGLRQQITPWLSVFLRGGYRWHKFESIEPAPAIGGGVQLWP